MVSNLSTTYEEKQECLQKRFVKFIKIFLKKKKKKSSNRVANDINILLKMKNKDWLTPKKINVKCGEIKTLHNKGLVLKMLG